MNIRIPLWMRHLYQRRSFRQLMFKILLGSLLFLVSVIFIIPSIINSDFIVTKFHDPVVNIQGAELSKCCILDTERDLCGRRDCMQCQSYSGQEDLPIKPSDCNAFFHETSGAGELDTRQACAVESLALLNRNLNIYLLTTSHDHINLTAPTMDSLSHYPNIRMININLGRYFLGTPLEHWYFCTTWNYGPFSVSHLSDALRFLTNYKYGGYYFDLDVIHLRSSESGRNFVVAGVGFVFIESAAFHADYNHPVIQLAIDEFRNTYRKDVWGHNGPELFTRLMKRWFGVDDISLMITGKDYKGFQVLPFETFYSIPWLDWKTIFASSERLPQWSEHVIGIHVWNRDSSKHPVYKHSDQVYTKIARTRCPLTFGTAPEVF